MRIKLFLLLFSISFFSFAQVPGYMGKRFSVAYSLWMHPSFGGAASEFFGSGSPEDGLSLNTTHALEMNYIVGTRSAIALTFHFAFLGLKMADDNYYSNADYKYTGNNKYAAVLYEKGLSIGYKLFSRGKIAPVGSYIKWDIMGLFNTVKFDRKSIYKYTENYNPSTYTTSYSYVPVLISTEKINSFGAGVAVSLGRQRVFFNKLITDVGVRFSLAIAPDPDSSGSYEDHYPVFGRVFSNQFVNLRFGLGFLAF